MKKLIVLLLMLTISTSVSAAEIPPESLPSNATFECMEYTESLISDILDKVQNGLGFSDAQAEARRRFFALVVSGQSNGYSFSQLNKPHLAIQTRYSIGISGQTNNTVFA